MPPTQRRAQRRTPVGQAAEAAGPEQQQQAPRATFAGRLRLDAFLCDAGAGSRAEPRPLLPRPPPRRSPRRERGDGSAAGDDEDAGPASSAAVTTTATSSRGAQAPGPSSSSPSSSPPSSSSPQRPRRQRRSARYAPPSTYAHLPLLPDALAADLLVLFVGLNPGLETARRGHAYAHPSNLFWRLLFSSGLTPRPCRPDDDRRLPELFALGLTNIVARPSRSAAELRPRELDDGVAALEEKARRWRPRAVCVVGKGIWESIWRVRHAAPVGDRFRYGWQPPEENLGVVRGQWPGARVFVASSTSGLAASLSPAEKQRIWAELGSWVKARRAEREAAPGPAAS